MGLNVDESCFVPVALRVRVVDLRVREAFRVTVEALADGPDEEEHPRSQKLYGLSFEAATFLELYVFSSQLFLVPLCLEL